MERLLRDGVDPPGDARLLERFRVDGDEAAFALIVERHGPLVLALCRRYLREPADVDDAFQATFLVLARNRGGLRDGDALAGWLYGVARRVALRARSNVLKRRAREADADRLDEIAAAADRPPDDALEALDRELSRLPEKYRAPLVLCHLRGRSYDQAAAELGWPPGTARSRAARGRAILRARLSRRGIDAPACLAAIRLDVACSPLASAALAVETAAAAGRFVGLARLALFTTSSRWPAAALAQGVMTTMVLSSWKLLGFGIASIGLSAGALAVAATALAPVAQEESPKQQEPPPPAAASEKPGPVPVDRRLDDLEAKLDRLAATLAERDAAPSSPVAAGDRDAATGAVVDGQGLREIEARLINAHQVYDRLLRLRERNVIPQQQVDVAVEPVRVILGQLMDMRDEIGARRDEIEFDRAIAELERAAARDSSRPRLDRAREAKPADLKAERIRREIDRLDEGARRIDRLIAWTREHFPDAELTILDDAPKEVKKAE